MSSSVASISPVPPRPTGETLLVFAHRDEAAAFKDVPHLVTGVGKIAAASTLMHAVMTDRHTAHHAARYQSLGAVGVAAERADAPESPRTSIRRVVVLGTAGVVRDGDATPDFSRIYQITAALQHDFSLPSPRLEISGGDVLSTRYTATIATGDTFVADDAQRTAIAALGADLVDMETYSYANVCVRLGVPLQVFKVPSDFADSDTTDEDWDTVVHRKSRELRRFWDAYLAPLQTRRYR